MLRTRRDRSAGNTGDGGRTTAPRRPSTLCLAALGQYLRPTAEPPAGGASSVTPVEFGAFLRGGARPAAAPECVAGLLVRLGATVLPSVPCVATPASTARGLRSAARRRRHDEELRRRRCA